MSEKILVRRVLPKDVAMIEELANYHVNAFGHSHGRQVKDRVNEMVCHANKTPDSNPVPMTLIALIDGKLAGSCRICEDDFDGVRPDLTPLWASV